MSRNNSKSNAASSQALESGYLSKTLANSELIRRLKIVTETLEAYSDEDEVIEQAKKDIEHLADALGSDWLMQNKSKDVRLLVACGLADVLRIYAPDPPYSEDVNAAVIRLFLKILRGFESPDMNPDHPSYSIHFFLLERLNVISIFSIINELVHHRDELLKELAQAAYSIVGNMPTHKAAAKVTEHLTSILCCVIEEMESYEMDLFDLIVGALCKNEKKENPAGWNMMKTVIASCENHFQPFVERQIHQVKAGLHPESELTNGERLAEAVYELSSIAPRVLTQVLPAYAEDLVVEDATVRIKAVKLLGAVFSVGNFHKDFALVFTEFKRRSLDKDSEVRKAMVNVVGLLLQKRPELSKSLLEDQFLFQGDQRDAPMYNLIVDHDERVRRDAVESVLDLCLQNSEAVPLAFLRHIAERTLDRKTAVRQVAIEGLCKLYQKYCAPFERKNLNAAVTDKFWWIPTRVITLYRPSDQELRVFLLRCLEDICMNVTTGRNTVHVAIDLYSSLDDKAQEVFISILRNRGKLHEAILKLHELRKQGSHNDLDSTAEKEESALFTRVAQSFQDSARAQEMMRSLYESKVQKIWEQLVDLIRKPRTNSEVQKVLDEVLKRLGPKSALIDFVRQLVWCISDKFFGVDFVDLVLRSLEDLDNEANAMAQIGLPVLHILASLQPALFSNMQGRIKSVLLASSENQDVAEHVARIIAYAAEELDSLQDDSKVLDALNSQCFSESADVAKFSARALLKIGGPNSQECKALVRSCTATLDFGPKLQGIFAVLSEIAKEAPKLLKPADQSNIAKFAKKVLSQPWPATASGKKDKKIVANTRRMALKVLCSLVLGQATDGKDGKIVDALCRELMADIEGVLATKGNPSSESVPDAEKALLRLTAGSCVLKVAKVIKLRDLLVTPKLFFQTALLCEDEDLSVRRTFAKKLWKGIGIQQGRLPFHYTAMLVLGAHESDATQLENVRTILKNILALMKRLRAISGKILATIAPEKILPWLVYSIVNHPTLEDAEEDDAHISISVKKYLEFFFNALTQAGTDEKIFPMLWLTLEHIKGCRIPDIASLEIKEQVVRRNVVITAEVGKRLIAKYGGQKKWDSDVLKDHLSKIVDASIFTRDNQAKEYTPTLPADFALSPARGKNSATATPQSSAQKGSQPPKDSAAKPRQQPAARKKLVADEAGTSERPASTRNMPTRGSKSAMRSLAEESVEEGSSEDEGEKPARKRAKSDKAAALRSSVEEQKAAARPSRGGRISEIPEVPATPPPKSTLKPMSPPGKRANGIVGKSTESPSPAAKTRQTNAALQQPATRRQEEETPRSAEKSLSPAPKSAQKKIPGSPPSQATRKDTRSGASSKTASSPIPTAAARQSRSAFSPSPAEWKSAGQISKTPQEVAKSPRRSNQGAAELSPAAKTSRSNKRARAEADEDSSQGLDSDSKTSAKVTPPANAPKASKSGNMSKKSAPGKAVKDAKAPHDAFAFDFDDEPTPPTRHQPAASSAKKGPTPNKSPLPSQTASSTKSPTPVRSPAPSSKTPSSIKSPVPAFSAKSPVPAKSPVSKGGKLAAEPAAAKAPAKGRASASHVPDVLSRLEKLDAAKGGRGGNKSSRDELVEAVQVEAPRAKRRRL